MSDDEMDIMKEEEICTCNHFQNTIHFSSTRKPQKRKCESVASNDVNEVLQRIKKIKFPIYIQIQTLNGRTIDLDVDSNETVAAVKAIVSEREGIPLMQQRLLYKGKQISDSQTIYSCGIEQGSVIYLIVALPHRSGVTGISREHRKIT